ncbi:MAG: trigger factor [Candidatus Omnitrophota bacterium]
MKVEVKKIDATRREMKIEVPKDRVTQAMDDVYKEIGKEAKVKGFRPGKVPKEILESHYGKLAQEETIQKVIPEVYQEGVEKEQLLPIDLPEIQDVSFKDGIISFTAKFDIRPDIIVKDYKGIKVTRKSSAVKDEEINKVFDMFKKGQGQEKEAKVDDGFAKSLGYPSLDAFKDSLKRQMEVDKDRQNRFDVENQIVEHLLKNTKVTVPQAVVKKQLEHRLSETKERMKQQGLKEDDIAKKEDQMRKDLEKVAEKDLKVYFIVEKIAQLEKIEIQRQENMVNKVIEFLLKEATWANEDTTCRT